MSKQSGFTFLELLLVLSIVAILTVVILPSGDRWVKKQSETEALHAFIATIHHAQAYAIGYEVPTAVKLRNSGASYSLFTPLTEASTVTLDFPPGMRVIGSSHSQNGVSFNNRGSVSEVKTIALQTSTGVKLITVQMEHGRILVRDQ
ncbi:type II secretion system protein [Sporosarcina sp. Sa2YVA2]|uniref:Type II secretion system protein n=1 Tax=Sporosarcina quadrami TaxID=2762234 RepID=A0ABR8U588_9BACL|nr:type II secretion system protein [Sporosarcina quadrami]MBD7983165.1 type II secretion system protein [Sporosarcina quadrami]